MFAIKGKVYTEPKSLYEKLVRAKRRCGLNVSERSMYLNFRENDRNGKCSYFQVNEKTSNGSYCEVAYVETNLPVGKLRYQEFLISTKGGIVEFSYQRVPGVRNLIIVFSHGLVCGVKKIKDVLEYEEGCLVKNKLLYDVVMSKIAQTEKSTKNNFLSEFRPLLPLPDRHGNYEKLFFDGMEINTLLPVKTNCEKNFIFYVERNGNSKYVKIISSHAKIAEQRVLFDACSRKKFKTITMIYKCITNYPHRIEMDIFKKKLIITVHY